MRLIDALKGKRTDTVPVWFMRQAGRFLPEYRSIREKSGSFFQLCQNVELSVEVTLLPVKILGVDAAILFSDLLVPLLPMRNLKVELVENVGPVIESKKNLSALDELITYYPVKEHLNYVAEIIKGVKSEIPDTPLIGFCGAPYTLISYIIEGGGSKNFVKTKRFMQEHPETFKRALFKLTDILSEYALMQIEAGVDAFQVFDSWVGSLSHFDYIEFIFEPTRKLLDTVALRIPTIYFSTGTAGILYIFNDYPVHCISVDWRIRLKEAALKLEGKSLQGNLDPCSLFAPKKIVAKMAKEILLDGLNAKAHIFNLGHGILPNTDPDKVKWLVDFVHQEGARLKSLIQGD